MFLNFSHFNIDQFKKKILIYFQGKMLITSAGATVVQSLIEALGLNPGKNGSIYETINYCIILNIYFFTNMKMENPFA